MQGGVGIPVVNYYGVCIGDAGWGRYTGGELLRTGGGVQCDGDGTPWAQSRGPLQLLQQVSGLLNVLY